MLLGLIGFVVAIIGIYGFFAGNIILLVIGTLTTIIETLIGIFTGQLKSLSSTIISIIIALIVANIYNINLINCIMLFLCIENVIMFIGGIVLLIFLYNKEKEYNKTIDNFKNNFPTEF